MTRMQHRMASLAREHQANELLAAAAAHLGIPTSRGTAAGDKTQIICVI